MQAPCDQEEETHRRLQTVLPADLPTMRESIPTTHGQQRGRGAKHDSTGQKEQTRDLHPRGAERRRNVPGLQVRPNRHPEETEGQVGGEAEAEEGVGVGQRVVRHSDQGIQREEQGEGGLERVPEDPDKGGRVDCCRNVTPISYASKSDLDYYTQRLYGLEEDIKQQVFQIEA